MHNSSFFLYIWALLTKLTRCKDKQDISIMQENKQEKSLIKQNISLYLAKKGVSDYEYYKQSGTTRGILGQNNGISEDNIARFLAYAPDVNHEWLLTGCGPMLKSHGQNDECQSQAHPHGDDFSTDKGTKNPDNEQTKPAQNSSYTSLANSKTKEVLHDISSFPLYNIDASAGLNKLFIGDSELLGQISIPNAPRCDGAVYVTGDSMYPLLKSGDIIAYRQVRNLDSIIYGEIYLIQLENDGDISIVVKYVKRSEKGDDYIKLVSYNKEHDPKDVPLSWIRAIARVTLTIRKFSIT